MVIELEDIACPICNFKEGVTIYSDNRMAGNSIEISITVKQCDGCGFIFNSPRPTETGLKKYYENSNLGSGQVFRDESEKGYYSNLHDERANFLKESLIFTNDLSLIDVGCGNGGFLKSIIKEIPDISVLGLDPSIQAVENCKKSNINVIQAAINELPNIKIDVDIISLISVLEHLTNPREAIRACKQSLGSSGIIYIEIPNTLKPEVSLTGFFNFEHIVHFTPSSLLKLLENEGFKFVKHDKSVDHVVRIVASPSNLDFFKGEEINYLDDSRDSLASIQKYAKNEKELVHSMRSKVKSKLQNWKSKNKKIAMYGAGLHSVELSSHIDLNSYVSCYLDGDINKQGKKFLGKKVYSPESVKHLNIDAVIISSGRFIDEMKRTVLSHGNDGIEVATCYE